MTKLAAIDQTTITQSIKNSIKKTDQTIKKRKRTNTRLLITGMATSAASTLVAGITSAGGPVIGTGIEGWRMACIAAASLSFAATISTGISQQLDSSSDLGRAALCLNRLRVLDINITTGSKSWEGITQEYREIAGLYPEYVS